MIDVLIFDRYSYQIPLIPVLVKQTVFVMMLNNCFNSITILLGYWQMKKIEKTRNLIREDPCVVDLSL